MKNLKHKSGLAIETAAVFILLAIHFIIAFSASLNKTATFDEPVHIAGGYTYWKFGDYRINPESGNFPQRWAALPLIFFKDSIKDSADKSDSRLKSLEFFHNNGNSFLYKNGNDADLIILKARTMIIILGLATGVTVYLCSRQIFGRAGGCLSLLLYCFCPSMTANSSLANADSAAALGFLLSTWSIWLMFEKITLSRLAFSSFSLSLLFLSKMSAPIIVPVYLILIGIRLYRKSSLELVLFRWKRVLGGQFHQLSAFIACGLINIISVVFFIWLSYGFSYSMSGAGLDGGGDGTGKEAAADSNFTDKLIRSAMGHRILPEAYLYGFRHIIRTSEYRFCYLNGEMRLTGWWYFFPYCMLVKTPLSLIVLLPICAGIFVFLLRNPKFDAGYGVRDKILMLSPFLVFSAVYTIFAMASNMNIGARHLLPLYPLAYVFAGSAAYLFSPGIKILFKAVPLLLVACFMLESLKTWPHYLAFFNQIAGGPKNAYRHLVDSSLDWGQDLKFLRDWLKENNCFDGANVYLSYFGTASVGHYLNVNLMPCCVEQEGGRAFEYKGGIYCISATMRPMIYLPELFNMKDLSSGLMDEALFNEVKRDVDALFKAREKSPESFAGFLDAGGREFWAMRYRVYNLLCFAKICRYLENREPDASAGYSILIYRLSDKEVEDALNASF